MMETLQPQVLLHAPELLSSSITNITTRNISGDKIIIPTIESESNWNESSMEITEEKEPKEAKPDLIVEMELVSTPVVTLSEVVRETLSSLGGTGTLDQIAKHIIANYPQKTTHKRWRTTIAGILSTHFSKKENEGTYQKQSIWSIEPSSNVKRSTRSGRGTNPKRSASSSNITSVTSGSVSASDSPNVVTTGTTSNTTETKRRVSQRSKTSIIEQNDSEGSTPSEDGEEQDSSKENDWNPKEKEKEVIIPIPVSAPIVPVIKKTPEIKDYVGVNLSYHQRVVMSLKALGGEGATYAQICEYFAIHFAKLIEEKKNWKQAIASELSHKFGRKIDKQQGVTLWTLDKDIQEKKPKLKPRKKRKVYGSNNGNNSPSETRRQSNITKKASTEYYYSDDSQDDGQELEAYRPTRTNSRDNRWRPNDNLLENSSENSNDSSPLSDEEYRKKRPKRSSSFNLPKRYSPSVSDSEKEETLGDSKKIEVSKWKKYVEEAIIKLQMRATLNEILEYIEMAYSDLVSKKRLWKNLVALCLKNYFIPESNDFWTINDPSKGKKEQIPLNFPENVTYRSSLDWGHESLREDREFFSGEFSYSFMRSKPRRKYVNGDIRVIDYTHPAYIKGVSEFGYFVNEDALPGDYLGEFAGVVQIRGKNLNSASSYLGALWDVEPDKDIDGGECNYKLQIDIDASKCGNELRFLNSCQNMKDFRGNSQNANATLIRMYDSTTRLPCLGLFATQKIPANFEVLLDYPVNPENFSSSNTNALKNESINQTTNQQNSANIIKSSRIYVNQIVPSKVCYKRIDQAMSDEEDTDEDN